MICVNGYYYYFGDVFVLLISYFYKNLYNKKNIWVKMDSMLCLLDLQKIMMIVLAINGRELAVRSCEDG